MIGFGRIAQATLKRVLPFAPARVLYTTSKLGQRTTNDFEGVLGSIGNAPAESYEQLARESDVIFVCCSLTPSTRNLVDAAFLKLVKPHCVIVNTGRGPIVDSDALAQALQEGRVFGEGVDVVAGEPDVKADHPLLQQPRCVVLPHIGSSTTATRAAMCELAVRNALAVLRDEPMPAELKL